MKNLKLLFVFALAAAGFFVTGCSKNNSNTPSSSSTDSVLYTNWAPLNMSGFVDNNADTFFAETIIAHSITSAVVEHGAVLTYLMNTDANGDTLTVAANTVMTQLIYPDSIYLESDPPFIDSSSAVDYSGFNFRYVVIPGKILTTRSVGVGSGQGATYTASQLQNMSYADVARIFNIPQGTIPRYTRPGPKTFSFKEQIREIQ